MRKIESYIKNADKPIAFILGASNTSLGAVRSLGREGIPVIVLDPNFGSIGFFSRYGKGIVCPNSEENEDEYIDFLLALGKQLNSKGVLISGSDADIFAVLKHRDELERYYRFAMAEFEVVEKLTNKRKFYETLDKLDMPRPKTYFPNGISAIDRISEGITYPCIVKPIFSTNFGKDFSVKLFRAESAPELVKAYGKATSSGYEVVIQEVIPGSDVNIYGFCSYFNHNSEPLGIFIYKKLRGYPEGFGICSLVESAFEPEIIKLGTQLLQRINYHGISEVEFKKDVRDDKFKIIEVNARIWAQNSLAARCGVNLPYMAYKDTLGEDVEKVISKKEGIKWLYMFEDIRSCFTSMLKGKLSIIEWINSLRGEKEYIIFARDDPLPSLLYPFDISRSALERLLRDIKSTAKKMT